MIESVHRQFPNLELAIIVSGAARKNLRYDWNTGDIPVLFDHASHVPSLVLKDPSGRVVWYREGVTPPGELGLALRSNNETATAR